MTAVSELPTWAVYLIGFGTPGSALVGVVWSQHLGRKAAKELEKRSKREEVMRNLRWAAELAVEADDRKAQLGIAQLNALSESKLLDKDQEGFIDAALQAVVEVPIEAIEQAREDVEVLEVVSDDSAILFEGEEIESEEQESAEGEPDGD